jgi:hypothetical protein
MDRGSPRGPLCGLSAMPPCGLSTLALNYRSLGLVESPAAGLSTVPSPPGSPQWLMARALHLGGLRALPRGELGPLAFWRARRSGSPRRLRRRALHSCPWRGLSTVEASGSVPCGEHGPSALWRARRPGSPRCLRRRALRNFSWRGLSTAPSPPGSPEPAWRGLSRAGAGACGSVPRGEPGP